MANAAQLHEDQIGYWNNAGAEKWVAAQDHTDVMLEPALAALMAKARVTPGLSVLDVGCGCGASTIELAKAAGPSGKVIGLDVSEPMLARAGEHLASYKNVQLICADASAYPFAAETDLIVSRFGVMFFGDPAAAFSNIRKALKPGGRLVFACWRPPDENIWMKVPLQAVYVAGVPELPRPGPEDPGPYSFADQTRVTRILTEAGFLPPRFTPADVFLDIAAGRGLAAAINQSTQIGGASRALLDQPEDLRRAAMAAIEKALAPYADGDSVKLPAAMWIVESEAE
jgi:SAM-dependent methyltransferase